MSFFSTENIKFIKTHCSRVLVKHKLTLTDDLNIIIDDIMNEAYSKYSPIAGCTTYSKFLDLLNKKCILAFCNYMSSQLKQKNVQSNRRQANLQQYGQPSQMQSMYSTPMQTINNPPPIEQTTQGGAMTKEDAERLAKQQGLFNNDSKKSSIGLTIPERTTIPPPPKTEAPIPYEQDDGDADESNYLQQFETN